MAQYNDVIRGPRGFTYEVKRSDSRKSITHVRDPQDELFAVVEYSPGGEEYLIEIDGGYTTREDLENLGLLSKMNIRESQAPVFENMIGSFEHEVIDDWQEVKYATSKSEKESLEIENIESDDKKTLIRLISTEGNISSAAETFINTFNPPFISGEPGDPYGKTWAPYGDGRIIRNKSEDREETIEEVFDTAIELTEDLLEKKQKK